MARERLEFADAAMELNRRCMALLGDDVDGSIARLQACIDVAMERVDEAARCGSPASKPSRALAKRD